MLEEMSTSQSKENQDPMFPANLVKSQRFLKTIDQVPKRIQTQADQIESPKEVP